MNEEQARQIVNAAVQGLALQNLPRTPILYRPSDYDMSYEDVFFHAIDGTVLEGWFIPSESDNLIICNHFGTANRSGFSGGESEFWKQRGVAINFLPKYKALHDAGYNMLAYDLRGHGLSAPRTLPQCGSWQA